MYERCLTEAERILASSRQIAVPVKEVWGKVSRLSRSLGFETASLADFTAMLEADRRFELLSSRKNPDDVQRDLFAEDDADESALELMGFYGEDRVKLKRIIVRRAEDEDGEESPIIVRGLSSSKPSSDAKKTKPAPSPAKRKGVTAPKKSPAPNLRQKSHRKRSTKKNKR